MFTFLVLYYYISQDSFVHPANEMRIGKSSPSLAETLCIHPNLFYRKDKKGNIVTDVENVPQMHVHDESPVVNYDTPIV